MQSVKETLSIQSSGLLALILLSVIPWMFSPMILDSPYASAQMHVLFLIVFTFPFVCLLAIGLSWLLYWLNCFRLAVYATMLPYPGMFYFLLSVAYSYLSA